MKRSVYLRAFKVEDAAEINKWRNNESIIELTCGRFRYVGIEMERSWVNSKIMNNSTEEYLAICLNDGSDKIIGYQCIRHIDMVNRSAHGAGIIIDPDYQDGTYMVDANILLLNYVFRHIGVNRYTGSCLEEHKKSRIMMEMLGFILEGIERESLYKHHEYKNICRYSILYSDYCQLLKEGGYSIKAVATRASKISKQL